ncbi:MAG: hypothetical protein ACJ8MR_20485 [Povalibacter sp.]
MLRLASLLMVIGCALSPMRAHAQYEVDEDKSVWIRALLDVRAVYAGPLTSWVDGGTGRTRYGGKSSAGHFEHDSDLVLSQLDLQFGANLPWGIRAQAQANVQPDIADTYEPWLVEAFLRKEWAREAHGWGLQVGLMNNPFSLEHTGPAWTPEYTLSASALNSWLWEELPVGGLEAEWFREPQEGLKISIIAGAGYGPDQLGRLLALRGWTMGDGLSGVNTELPLPNGTRTDIFDEMDHRAAAYTSVTVSDTEGRGAIKLGYFDNFGDQATAGVWHTRLANIGTTFSPLPKLDVIVQYLRGKALIRDKTNDSSLRAFYAMLSAHHQRHRVSVRYDEFRISDLDGGNLTAEHGDAITFGYAYEWGLRQRVAVEYIRLDSVREARPQPEPIQDSVQLSYRFRY